ncbi:MAG: Glycine/serine hydroxymethyltransferase [Candidatus Midichloria mitochondrii]|uniref:Serine hydroxymethyltransferase n=1 Tax=Midichloria mitochondrii (strain IricVA) TaxID=696127 RepID=F7XUP6_MIDMI|nr:serine hydroxymethyltransferase [Candidatus Midichloria mitochondrii]AEI88395.1 glycine/serine hydroxymethyltransferase [Candidatus Midichloria mitochondrii IricVA]MDJ1256694.1 serine hydroxymethyltransferase [Candidatus Midichloria mitochondrii]MDJ1288407.1 serine hydroxymethyltransferase [Candidatus Midichloria mitochondrii]MDJ1299257.1 serine hydroxymethyltransferase [Candidatus Midichloria mitochondrii]MDJ1313372.1 serine hydroxymethyltransferase [Candidatus Midichloria mitochondrii]
MAKSPFFANSLANADPIIFQQIQNELDRQQDGLELIASENIVSKAVLEAQGSILTNKYAEGYPGKRYYGGCQYVDEIENIAIERAKLLFEAQFASVQPHSGSQANQAVFLALLKPGDAILSLSLDCGGHLTHGSPVNQSGKWFQAMHYTLNPENFLLDYDQIKKLALEHKPKLIIAGYSAYPRQIDFAKFREIADQVGARLMVDMAHIAGLVAVGIYDNPLRYAHVVTTTTHKTLRGPRGGMILTNHQDIAKLINSAIFPGLQGGPLVHVIAAKAVALAEALKPEYKDYIRNVVSNCKILADNLLQRGCSITTNGTDNHLLIMDLRKQGLTGKDLEESLERAGLTCNKNNIPFDTQKPTVTSGIRLGTAACTTRGLQEEDFVEIADWIAEIIHYMKTDPENLNLAEITIRQKVNNVCKRYPIY